MEAWIVIILSVLIYYLLFIFFKQASSTINSNAIQVSSTQHQASLSKPSLITSQPKLSISQQHQQQNANASVSLNLGLQKQQQQQSSPSLKLSSPEKIRSHHHHHHSSKSHKLKKLEAKRAKAEAKKSRVEHVIIEKRYRMKITDSLNELKYLLPGSDDKKVRFYKYFKIIIDFLTFEAKTHNYL